MLKGQIAISVKNPKNFCIGVPLKAHIGLLERIGSNVILKE